MLLDDLTVVVRHDGSRATARIRTHPSKVGSETWEAEESKTLYLATENTTYDIFPALKMFGRTPVGRERNRPLIPMADCKEFVPASARSTVTDSDSPRFGRKAITYKWITDNPTGHVTMEVETFPELGCLVGNRTTEMHDKGSNSLLARKTEELLAMNVVPDDPSLFLAPGKDYTEGTPSAILQRDAEVKGKECPRCLIDAAKKFDARHEKLWSERSAGKR